MKVLHIGWGYRPFRAGGLIEYAEDLMHEEARCGYQVSYFFSGKKDAKIAGPRLKRWKRGKVRMYEIINSPLDIFHERYVTDFLKGALNDTVSEDFLSETFKEAAPDIVHIHELVGLPTSVIDVVAEKYGCPSLMTLQDYYPFCHTNQLFNSKDANCLDRDAGSECVICCGGGNPDFFRNRRQINIERLKKISRLVAMSRRVEEIYKEYLKECRISTMHLTVGHLDGIKAKKLNSLPGRVVFATLAGFRTTAKGAKILLEALKIVNCKHRERFKLLIFAGIFGQIRNEVLSFDNVVYKGAYDVKDLNRMLKDVHVGIVPSVWEECYGYVGVEFLAKGIPVIGSQRGGIPDYVIDGRTGWLNRSVTPQELAEIMINIIENPEQIIRLNQQIVADKERYIKTMKSHFFEMDEIYHSLIRSSGDAG